MEPESSPNLLTTPLHPNFLQQQALTTQTLNKLTFERISTYLSSKHSLTLTKFSQLSTNGVINFTYILQFQGNHQVAKNHKLFLRMANPHPFWKKIKTENEVAILKFVKEKTKVPVPIVLDFCSDREGSQLGGEFILMNYVDSDGDMEQYFKLTEGRYNKGEITKEEYFNSFKKLLEEGYGYVEQLLQIDIDGNHYICGFDLNLKPVPVNWDGHLVGPSKTIGSFLIQSLSHTLFNYEHRLLTQSDPQTKSLYELLHSPLKSVLSDLKGLQSANSVHPSFFFRHADLHAGNINVKDGHIVGVFDWEHSRMDIMFRDWEDLDMADMWFSDLQDREVYQRLREVERGLVKGLNEKYARPEWEPYRKYWKICYIASDTWFYVASWWNSDQSDWQKLVRAEARQGLEGLKKLLIEAHYL